MVDGWMAAGARRRAGECDGCHHHASAEQKCARIASGDRIWHEQRTADSGTAGASVITKKQLASQSTHCNSRVLW
eukprot:scaffold16416_cov52-Attheya_sp.AAC.8